MTRLRTHVSVPRRFQLMRYSDPSGVSGTGIVAQGVQFPDGWVAIRWPGEHASTAVWPSLESVRAIHGHHGCTEVQWIDFEPSRPASPVSSLAERLAVPDWY